MSKILAQERNAAFFLDLNHFLIHKHIFNMHHNDLILNLVISASQCNLKKNQNIFFPPLIYIGIMTSLFIQNSLTHNLCFRAYYNSVIQWTLLCKLLDHFNHYKTQRQLASLRIPARWIILTSMRYGLYWLPGCFWRQFKGLPLIYEAVYVLSQTLLILQSPTVGKMKQGTVVGVVSVIIQKQYLSQSSPPSCHCLGNSAAFLVHS